MAGADIDRTRLYELLPWYVNGTLSREEEREVRELIDQDEEAERQAAMLHRVRSAVRDREFGLPGELGLRRLRASLDAEQPVGGGKPGLPRWLKVAAAAALAVILVQAGLLLDTRYAPEGYEPAGVAPGRPVIQLRFEADARESAIRRLLVDLRLEIVAGPSSVGVYRVAPASDDVDIGQALNRLRERTEIVAFAERE